MKPLIKAKLAGPTLRCSLILLMLGLSGCTIATKRQFIVEKEGTVVVTTDDTDMKVLGPDKDGNLVPGTVKAPAGSKVMLGQGKAPAVIPQATTPAPKDAPAAK